ncbi:MAG: glycosyltransferase family 2 protein [Fibrobacterota bacterium]
MIATLQVLFWVSVCFVAYSYVVYPIILPLFARIFGRETRPDDKYEPTVGVVIPAYNEEDVIKKKIDNVLSFDYPPDKIRVWVGSDQSTDATETIVRKYGDPRVTLWVAQRRGGKTEILNNLVPQVSTDVVFLTDANTIHSPDSLRQLVKHFADAEVGAVAGHVEHVVGEQKQIEEVLYRSFEARQKFLESRLHSTISAFGGFYCMRTTLFRPIPHNAYSNDDVLIPMNVIRQGFRVVYEPKAVSQEDMGENIGMEFIRRIRIGAGNFQAFFWLLDFVNPFRGWPAFCFLSHKATRWFSPLFMALGLVSCALLSVMVSGMFYKVLLMTGLIGIATGLSFRFFRLNTFRPVFYFLTMNAALLLGFFRFVGGIKSAAWTRTARS